MKMKMKKFAVKQKGKMSAKMTAKIGMGKQTRNWQS
jgi:hypothetical protein